MASDITLTNTANSVLYALFALVGFIAGSVTNKIGVRPTLTVYKVLFCGVKGWNKPKKSSKAEFFINFHAHYFLYRSVVLVMLSTLHLCGCMIPNKFLVMLLPPVQSLVVVLVCCGQLKVL